MRSCWRHDFFETHFPKAQRFFPKTGTTLSDACNTLSKLTKAKTQMHSKRNNLVLKRFSLMFNGNLAGQSSRILISMTQTVLRPTTLGFWKALPTVFHTAADAARLHPSSRDVAQILEMPNSSDSTALNLLDVFFLWFCSYNIYIYISWTRCDPTGRCWFPHVSTYHLVLTVPPGVCPELPPIHAESSSKPLSMRSCFTARRNRFLEVKPGSRATSNFNIRDYWEASQT